MKRALAAAAALSFCLSTTAHAQDAETPTETTSPAGPTVGYYDEGGNWVPPSRGRAPDTDNCPQATWPPEPLSSTSTQTATFGSSAGAKPTNQAWVSFPVSNSAEPVFPATV